MGKADLHIHTTYSDGSADPGQVLLRARDAGLDTVAIADHNTIEGALAARRLAARWRLPVAVIVAEEVSTADGHVLGLFLERPIRPLLSAAATVDEIHRQGGLAVAVHPFSWWLRLFRCGGVGRLVERLQFDAIETVNGAVTEQLANFRTKAYNRRVARLAELGGSDAHTVEAVGQAYTVYPGRGQALLRQAIYHKATRTGRSRGTMAALTGFLKSYLAGRMDLYGPKGGALTAGGGVTGI